MEQNPLKRLCPEADPLGAPLSIKRQNRVDLGSSSFDGDDSVFREFIRRQNLPLYPDIVYLSDEDEPADKYPKDEWQSCKPRLDQPSSRPNSKKTGVDFGHMPSGDNGNGCSVFPKFIYPQTFQNYPNIIFNSDHDMFYDDGSDSRKFLCQQNLPSYPDVICLSDEDKPEGEPRLDRPSTGPSFMQTQVYFGRMLFGDNEGSVFPEFIYQQTCQNYPDILFNSDQDMPNYPEEDWQLIKDYQYPTTSTTAIRDDHEATAEQIEHVIAYTGHPNWWSGLLAAAAHMSWSSIEPFFGDFDHKHLTIEFHPGEGNSGDVKDPGCGPAVSQWNNIDVIPSRFGSCARILPAIGSTGIEVVEDNFS